MKKALLILLFPLLFSCEQNNLNSVNYYFSSVEKIEREAIVYKFTIKREIFFSNFDLIASGFEKIILEKECDGNLEILDCSDDVSTNFSASYTDINLHQGDRLIISLKIDEFKIDVVNTEITHVEINHYVLTDWSL